MSPSTSERNVELIRQLLDSVNQGGSKAVLARMEEFADPEVQWIGVAAGRDAPGGNVVYHGYEGMRRFWEEIDEVFEEIHFGDLTIEALGDDVVLARMTVSGTGHSSGVRIEHEMGVVYRFREGKVASGENFASQTDAADHAHRLGTELRS